MQLTKTIKKPPKGRFLGSVTLIYIDLINKFPH